MREGRRPVKRFLTLRSFTSGQKEEKEKDEKSGNSSILGAGTEVCGRHVYKDVNLEVGSDQETSRQNK